MKEYKLLGFRINKLHIIGVTVALLIVILSLIFIRGDLLYFILGIAFVVAGLPFFLSLILESRVAREKEEMFIEFSRNLVESVKSGTPISKSILNIRDKNYGSLNPHIDKLANQISLGIPLQNAFHTFARDVKNTTITRSISIISESEKAGGKIEAVLESVVKSISQIENLRKERKAAIYAMVVQGYIIFLIFIVIMVVMQFKILPIAGELGGVAGGVDVDAGIDVGGFEDVLSGEQIKAKELARPFFWLLIIQGFFAGLVIGKLSEGKIISGLRHSFILLVLALLINTGANVFFG